MDRIIPWVTMIGLWLFLFSVASCSGASADYIDLEPDYPDDAIVYRSNA